MISRAESSAGPGKEVGGMNDGEVVGVWAVVGVEESLAFRVEMSFLF